MYSTCVIIVFPVIPLCAFIQHLLANLAFQYVSSSTTKHLSCFHHHLKAICLSVFLHTTVEVLGNIKVCVRDYTTMPHPSPCVLLWWDNKRVVVSQLVSPVLVLFKEGSLLSLSHFFTPSSPWWVDPHSAKHRTCRIRMHHGTFCWGHIESCSTVKS